jgi:hypothetical protein
MTVKEMEPVPVVFPGTSSLLSASRFWRRAFRQPLQRAP